MKKNMYDGREKYIKYIKKICKIKIICNNLKKIVIIVFLPT